MKKAIVLLSGGLDSATVLAQAISDGFEVVSLSFRYGQRHDRELLSARLIADHFKTRHHVFDVDLSAWGDSALTDLSLSVPTEGVLKDQIPVTYVPGRNTVFIAIALSFAEAIQAERLYLGINAVDYSGYPDCRPEYLLAFQELANISSRVSVSGNPIILTAPLIYLSKVEIVKKAMSLGVPIESTWSCYQGGDYPCGVCDSCRIRDAALAAVLKENLECFRDEVKRY